MGDSEVEALRRRVAELEAENARLTEQLAHARSALLASPVSGDERLERLGSASSRGSQGRPPLSSRGSLTGLGRDPLPSPLSGGVSAGAAAAALSGSRLPRALSAGALSLPSARPSSRGSGDNRGSGRSDARSRPPSGDGGSAGRGGGAPADGPAPSGTALCSNCGRHVPAGNLSNHQLHCLRHTAKCDKCGMAVAAAKLAEHMAAAAGSPADMVAACTDGDLEAVKLMVTHGASCVDPISDTADTPLHIASRACQSEVMAFLMELGANHNATNAHKERPVHLACANKRHEDAAKAVMLLLASGADVAAGNALGDTPLALAQRAGNTSVALLLSRSGSSLRAAPSQ